MSTPLLRIQDLRVQYSPAGSRGGGTIRALDGVSFDLARGEVLAIVGETGSGKTTLARALLGLHPTETVTGSIQLGGRELSGIREQEWQSIRWRRIALAVQNAGTAFDPVYTIGAQLQATVRQHLPLSRRRAVEAITHLVRSLGLDEHHLHAYPHQLSGGEKQRLMLAMALSCHPDVLIVDEPTSGQDMLSRRHIVTLLQKVQTEADLSILLITHDLAAVAQLAHRVAVLYAGKLAEIGTNREVLGRPRHPYTWALRNAYPDMGTARDLSGIRGHMPDPANPPAGCRFHPRCTQAVAECRLTEPALEHHDSRLVACHLGGLQTLLQARHLAKSFGANGHRTHASSQNGARQVVAAVKSASLEIYEGEVVALVGATGSGKTTLGKLLVGLLTPDTGTIAFQGQAITTLAGAQLVELRRRIQFVPQDPFDSVSPRLTVQQIVREPLDIQQTGNRDERNQEVHNVLESVGLPTSEAFLARYAHELSGGQLQRVVIARALVLAPKLVIADEPVSMLDASEQAKLINLLKAIQNERGMGLLVISHDLALVRKIADRILVMQGGQIIEHGPAGQIVNHPQHDYTRTLLSAAPSIDWYAKKP
ncbi:MAG: ABC transporter ATP-binding protein [Chloroflexi bacterium]|nr:ABC transporter ATP-binding protein [Chloroflexota bacterium]